MDPDTIFLWTRLQETSSPRCLQILSPKASSQSSEPHSSHLQNSLIPHQPHLQPGLASLRSCLPQFPRKLLLPLNRHAFLNLAVKSNAYPGHPESVGLGSLGTGGVARWGWGCIGGGPSPHTDPHLPAQQLGNNRPSTNSLFPKIGLPANHSDMRRCVPEPETMGVRADIFPGIMIPNRFF